MTDGDRPPRLTVGQHVAETVVRVQQALAPHNEARADRRLTGWLEAFESEMRDTIAPLLEKHAANPEMPAEVRDLFSTLIDPPHQVTSSILFAVLGALFYPIVSSAMAGVSADVQQAALHNQPVVALSPAEVALGKVRNTLGGIDPHTEVSYSGMSPDRFDVMALNTGDAIAVGDALLLYRRGQLSEADLLKAVRQSRVRDEWFDSILALRFVPPPAGEVIAGAIKNHLTDTEAQQKLGEAGIDPANFGWMRASAGRPPGIEQMLSLWNRGLATQADVEAAVRQSDINDAFLPFVLNDRWYVPPVRTIVAMLRAHAIDDTQATTLFQHNGVRPEDIAGYLNEAHHGRTATTKAVSQGMIVRLLEQQLITQAEAESRLAALGYQPADIAVIVELANNQRTERYVNALVAKAHSLYVAYKIDATEVHNLLGADGIDPAATGQLLRLWDLERSANVTHPSVAQIVGAYRRGEITALDCKQRLLARGVQQADLAIIVADGFPPTKPNPTAVAAVVNA